jgi:hypothetical protein
METFHPFSRDKLSGRSQSEFSSNAIHQWPSRQIPFLGNELRRPTPLSVKRDDKFFSHEWMFHRIGNLEQHQ